MISQNPGDSRYDLQRSHLPLPFVNTHCGLSPEVPSLSFDMPLLLNQLSLCDQLHRLLQVIYQPC